MAEKKCFIPDEIISEIFSQLPAKSVLRFMGCSSAFQQQFRTPGFISSHLARNPRREHLIFIDLEGKIHYFDVSGRSGSGAREIKLPLAPQRFVDCGGSCNGLVLLITEQCANYILNPMTVEYEKVSELGCPETLDSTFGLGYDEKNQDYKIVAISAMVHVYSLSKKVWKMIGEFPFSKKVISHGVFDGGKIHFLANQLEKVIVVAFNFETEVFDEVFLPTTGINFDEFHLTELSVLNGRLSLIYTSTAQMQIWVRKVYGEKDSWVKLCEVNFGNLELRITKPVIQYFSPNDSDEIEDGLDEIEKDGIESILLLTDNWEFGLLRYFVVANVLKVKKIDNLPKDYATAVSFVGSLVSPS